MFRRKGRPRRRVSFSLPWMYDSGRAGVYLLMRRCPLWMRFPHWMPCCPSCDADPYLLLQQDFAELFARQLPDDAFHLQVKERSQNLGRVQARVFHDVVNGLWFVCAEQFVQLFLRAIERGSGQQISLFGFGLLGLDECRADGCWQLFNHVIGVGDQLGSLFDQLIGGKAHRLRDGAGHSEDLPAKFHCETRGNQRTAVLCAFNHDDSERHARNNAVSHRKILRRGMRPQWKLAYDRPALQDFFIELSIFFRVANINARAENSDGAPIRIQSTLMPDGVNATGQAADDHKSTCRKFPAKTLRHLRAVERRAARADDAE